MLPILMENVTSTSLYLFPAFGYFGVKAMNILERKKTACGCPCNQLARCNVV